MEDLREIYRTPDVTDLCPTCVKWAENQLDEIRSAQAPELRRRITERLNKNLQPTRWQRFRALLNAQISNDPPSR